MKRNILVWLLMSGVAYFSSSCKNSSLPENGSSLVAENKIFQQDDGTISLNIDNAACYHDMVNPASNTAEWNVVVSRSGRFNVWLSSATIDTTNLRYTNSVLLSIRDKRIESVPVISRVEKNATDVSKPFYKADSFMGSLYIQDTGVYNIQMISDKILPKDYDAGQKENDHTKIISVVLTPAKNDSLK